MSVELIPPTPAKTVQNPPVFKLPSPQEDVIKLCDSENEEVVDDDAPDVYDDEQQYPEIQLEESNDEGEEDHEDGSATKSIEDSLEILIRSLHWASGADEDAVAVPEIRVAGCVSGADVVTIFLGIWSAGSPEAVMRLRS